MSFCVADSDDKDIDIDDERFSYFSCFKVCFPLAIR